MSDLDRLRRVCEYAVSLPWPRPAHTVHPIQHPELNGLWIEPAGVSPLRVILYLHGGGFVCCSPRTHRSITAPLANLCAARVLSLAYRLVPEHPYPAALEDCVNAYRWLLEQGIAPENIAVAGDSAGGYLALALTAALPRLGLKPPSAVVGFSPVTELNCSSASLTRNDLRCGLLSKVVVARVLDLVLNPAGDAQLQDSLFSADLKDFPPILLHVSENEVLFDHSLDFAERAYRAGVPVKVKIWRDLPHVWQLWHPLVPEMVHSLREAADFLRSHLG